ncbi:hypothetical protein ACFL35_06000 [Candidatus Riflebacteria bacterium]
MEKEVQENLPRVKLWEPFEKLTSVFKELTELIEGNSYWKKFWVAAFFLYLSQVFLWTAIIPISSPIIFFSLIIFAFSMLLGVKKVLFLREYQTYGLSVSKLKITRDLLYELGKRFGNELYIALTFSGDNPYKANNSTEQVSNKSAAHTYEFIWLSLTGALNMDWDFQIQLIEKISEKEPGSEGSEFKPSCKIQDRVRLTLEAKVPCHVAPGTLEFFKEKKFSLDIDSRKLMVDIVEFEENCFFFELNSDERRFFPTLASVHEFIFSKNTLPICHGIFAILDQLLDPKIEDGVLREIWIGPSPFGTKSPQLTGSKVHETVE